MWLLKGLNLLQEELGLRKGVQLAHIHQPESFLHISVHRHIAADAEIEVNYTELGWSSLKTREKDRIYLVDTREGIAPALVGL